MNEWVIVTVLATVVGLIITIVTPVVKLNTTITKLATFVDVMQDTLKELSSENSKDHRCLWIYNNEQDEKLANHDMRLHVIEEKRQDERA